jgi:hypothetical protein
VEQPSTKPGVSRDELQEHPDRAERAAEIGKRSPEGVPAHPGAGPKQISLLLAAFVVLLFVVALAIGLLISSAAGAMIGLIALVVFIANPAVWASGFRAKERHEIQQTRRDARGRADAAAPSRGATKPQHQQ